MNLRDVHLREWVPYAPWRRCPWYASMPSNVPRVSPDDAEEGGGVDYGDTPREAPETWAEEVPRDVRDVVMEGAWMPGFAREEAASMPGVVHEEGAFPEHL